MKKVLVTYATKTGTTKGIAEIVAQELEQKGHQVNLKPVADATDVDAFDAVVVGSPVNALSWLSDANAFIDANGEVLRQKTTAVFTVSYFIGAAKPAWKQRVRNNLKKIADSVNASMYEAFGGKVDNKMPAPMRLMFGIAKDAPQDVRDDEQVRKWAQSFAQKLDEPKE